jgi:hypothetical protein
VAYFDTNVLKHTKEEPKKESKATGGKNKEHQHRKSSKTVARGVEGDNDGCVVILGVLFFLLL